MTLVMHETRDRYQGRGTVRRGDGDTGGGEDKATGGGGGYFADSKAVDKERQEMEGLFDEEWRWMETLLVYEVERWEERLWERSRGFVGGSPEKQRLTRQWRGNSWKRLDSNIRAMDARMDVAKTTVNGPEFDAASWKWRDTRKGIQKAWQAVIERFMESDPSSSTPSMPLQHIEDGLGDLAKPTRWYQAAGDDLSVQRLNKQREAIASRLRKELEDVKEWLTRGLERCDQFWVDDQLLRCRHSQSIALTLHKPHFQAPLEVYSRALKQKNTTTHIFFIGFNSDDDRHWIADTICGLPSLTSIMVPNPKLLPFIDRTTALFIDNASRHPDFRIFLKDDSQLARSQGTFVFFTRDGNVVSFVGPTSGNLILRLTHRSTPESTSLSIMGTSFQLSLSPSLTVDDITLHPSRSESDKPSFEPGIRNSLVIQVTRSFYCVYDIQLLDQRGDRYDAASQSPEGVSAARCVIEVLNISRRILHTEFLLDVRLPLTGIDLTSSRSWRWNIPALSSHSTHMADVLNEDNDGAQLLAHRW